MYVSDIINKKGLSRHHFLDKTKDDIGLLNCINVNTLTEQLWIIDYQIFDPDKDGKVKVDHIKNMLNNVIHHKKLAFKTVLMDSWYANYQLMLPIHHTEKYAKINSTEIVFYFCFYDRIDFVMTNDTGQFCAADTKKICAIRLYVEQFYREIKQLTRIEKCQCRKQRIQRKHIACAIYAEIFLKKIAYKTSKPSLSSSMICCTKT